MNKASLSVLLVAASSLVGCASGYKQFYKPAQGATPEAISAFRLAPPSGAPLLERAQPTDAQVLLDAYAKRGFVMIGSAQFNSGRPETEDAAVAQGREVGADLVLVINPRYTGSTTSSIPITTPTTTTAYSTATATAYGPRGTATAVGSGTTTTYGSTTQYVPITINRSDYGAVFFIRQRFNLGAFFRDLSDVERQEMQTNKGAVIRLIVDTTPAFQADLLVGDIVTAIDSVAVQSSDALNSLLRDRRGRSIVLSILRRGQPMEKSVTLNP